MRFSAKRFFVRSLSPLLLIALAGPLSAAVPGAWKSLGPPGGSVSDLVLAPSRPQTMYAATGTAVFRSLDGGASWVDVSAGLGTPPSVSAVAVDPTHPMTVYANSQGGIYKSLDGGATWTKKAPNFGVSEIVAPVSNRVYVSTTNGFFESTNGGGAWTLLTRGLPNPYRAGELVVDPSDPNRLYAVAVGINSHVYGVFKSVDGGSSWKRSDSGIPVDQGISALAIDPSSPKILYAATFNDRVFKSRDSGASWRSAGPALDDPISFLWVDPKRSNLVYAATVPGLSRSDDGGASWVDVAQSLPAGAYVSALVFPPGTPRTVLAGVFTYGGVERGGVFASQDSGGSWMLRSKGLSSLDVTSIAVSPDLLWAVANAVLFKSADRGATWARVRIDPSFPVTFVAVNPLDPATVYAVVNQGPVWRSRDGGRTWERGGDPGGGTLTKLVPDPRLPETLYALVFNGIAKSDDGGATWTRLVNLAITDFVISPSSPAVFYGIGRVGNGIGVLRSADGGVTWAPTPANVPEGAPEALAVDPQAPNTLYVVAAEKVYRTTDGGATWSQAGDAFPGRTLRPLVFPVGSSFPDLGVWLDDVYRLDGGDTWEPLGKLPVQTGFNTLVADPQDSCRLYAGTLDRGLFVFIESGAACR